jgi:hypothetical protein
MHYNRKERKKLAKQFGLKTKNETQKQKQERVARSMIAGNQIHQQFLMQTENDVRNQLAEKEAQSLKSLTESLGAETAARIVANNKMLEDKRREKLFKKKSNR